MVRHYPQQGHNGKAGEDVEPRTSALRSIDCAWSRPFRGPSHSERDRECEGATRDETLLAPEQKKQLNFPAT